MPHPEHRPPRCQKARLLANQCDQRPTNCPYSGDLAIFVVHRDDLTVDGLAFQKKRNHPERVVSGFFGKKSRLRIFEFALPPRGLPGRLASASVPNGIGPIYVPGILLQILDYPALARGRLCVGTFALEATPQNPPGVFD